MNPVTMCYAILPLKCPTGKCMVVVYPRCQYAATKRASKNLKTHWGESVFAGSASEWHLMVDWRTVQESQKGPDCMSQEIMRYSCCTHVLHLHNCLSSVIHSGQELHGEQRQCWWWILGRNKKGSIWKVLAKCSFYRIFRFKDYLQ